MRNLSVSRLVVITAALLAFSPLRALAQQTAPDLHEICKKHAKKELGIDKKKDIKIHGKRVNSEGFTVLDFTVSDGSKGSCMFYKNGKFGEVKLTSAAPAAKPAPVPAPAPKTTRQK